jgi:predicted transposase YbfD/YdcC
LTSSISLTGHLDWPGVQQVCRLQRTTTRKGQTTTETQYAITSVSRDRADASQLLRWWRGHWGIENKVHWVRDEVFGEDRCRVRSGAAPQILASVRNLVMNWFRSRNIDTIAHALRENAWNPQRLFTQLGKPNL